MDLTAGRADDGGAAAQHGPILDVVLADAVLAGEEHHIHLKRCWVALGGSALDALQSVRVSLLTKPRTCAVLLSCYNEFENLLKGSS